MGCCRRSIACATSIRASRCARCWLLSPQEFEALEENVEQLYDDQFIETCADWVAPYIGDLIGYRPLHGVARRKVASPRAEVANTIALSPPQGHGADAGAAGARRDRLAGARGRVLRAARDHAVHEPHPAARAGDSRPALATRRCSGRAARSTAVAHTAEMRRPESGVGRYNIPNIGIFLWRLQPLRLTAVPLTPDPGDTSGRKFRVNPLGADLPLFRRPQTEDDISHIAEPINVPEPLVLRLMARGGARKKAGGRCGPRLTITATARASCSRSRADPHCRCPSSEVVICRPARHSRHGGNVVAWNHQDGIRDGQDRHRSANAAACCSATTSSGPCWRPSTTARSRPIGGGEYERTPLGEELPNQRTIGNGAPLQSAAGRRGSGRTVGDRRQPHLCADADTDVQGRRCGAPARPASKWWWRRATGPGR